MFSSFGYKLCRKAWILKNHTALMFQITKTYFKLTGGKGVNKCFTYFKSL